ncbi:MAG: hypothetical protein K8S22_15685, partial [Betaproteobacteria bacterium]|nr:hypothetical protein [Betaproteobacteria bacterium]
TGQLRIGRGGATDSGMVYCSLTSSVARTGPQVTAAFGPGNLDIGDGTATNCMRALAKSEAYFARPGDLFGRGDGKAEYGSLYSPYWQARLLPNSFAEQAVSLFWQGLSFDAIKSAWDGSPFESWVN